MKFSISLAVVAACTLVSSGLASASTLVRVNRPVPGRYIIVFDEKQVRRSEVASVAEETARAHGAQVRRAFANGLRGFSATMNESAAIALSRNPRVSYVQEVTRIEVASIQSNAPWGLDRIDQRALPLDGKYDVSTFSGKGVDVYVIDTGIRNSHSEFGGRVVDGTDLVDGYFPAEDCHGHGTHVAATIAGAISGVAKEVRLIDVRILDCYGSGGSDDAIAAIDWIVGHHQSGKTAVVNMSVGSEADPAWESAIVSSISDGLLYVAAAGNNGDDACNYTPGRAAAVFNVAASSTNDQRASYSNYGSCVDIFAPGNSVISAAAYNDFDLVMKSGTSMAAPHVSGLAAIIISRLPGAAVDDVMGLLRSTATTGAIGNSSGSPNLLAFARFNFAERHKSDFNGDGKSDLLWRNPLTGDVDVWFLDGALYSGGAALYSVADSNWRLATTGDLNGDDRPDLIWRNHSTGDVNVWFMNGTTYLGGASLLSVSNSDWAIVSANDFNADGHDDLLWRNATSGQVNIWFLNGTTYLSGAELFTAPAEWTLVGSSDLNGDFQPDLLWQHDDGTVNAWFMNGAQYVSGATLPLSAGADWRIGAVADFNGDRKSDIVWRNLTSGEVNVWFLDGTTYVSGAQIGSAESPWQVSGPR